MTIEHYLDLWALDAPIPADDLDTAARNVPLLHAKWWRSYSTERLRYRKLELEYKTLLHNKHEWLSGKMLDDDREALGWPPQPKLIRLKDDIQRHLDADPDMQRLAAQRALCEEAMRFLEDVIKNINSRGYNIKTAADYLRWKMGM